MIHFDQSPEPDDFDTKVRQKGLHWIETNPEGRPRDFWTPCKAQLANVFGGLCAYSTMYEPVGTVDHFVSCKENRALAYEWGNYRFSAQWINSSKNAIPDGMILDPFEVEDSWFELLLPSLQLVVARDVPDDIRDRAQFSLQRLHLVDDERILRQRREWYRMYQDGEITLDGLRKKAPLIARAVEGASHA